MSALKNMRGHGKKLRMDNCRRDIKKFSFPQRNIDVWNKLDSEIVQTKSISEFKAKLGKSRYGTISGRNIQSMIFRSCQAHVPFVVYLYNH